MTHASHNATNSIRNSNNEETTMSDTIITTAAYHPTNANWPAVLRIRLVAAVLPAKTHQLGYVWTATDAGNGDKDATINAANLAPKRVYTTRAAAIAAAEKDGWVVTSDTNAVSITRVNA